MTEVNGNLPSGTEHIGDSKPNHDLQCVTRNLSPLFAGCHFFPWGKPPRACLKISLPFLGLLVAANRTKCENDLVVRDVILFITFVIHHSWSTQFTTDEKTGWSTTMNRDHSWIHFLTRLVYLIYISFILALIQDSFISFYVVYLFSLLIYE